MIGGDVGRSDSLDCALARFGRAYAEQTEADHAALVRAVRRGTVPVTERAARAASSAFRPRSVAATSCRRPNADGPLDREPDHPNPLAYRGMHQIFMHII